MNVLAKDYFDSIKNSIFNELGPDEIVSIDISGESSNFVRFNNSKVRQIGMVDDLAVSFSLISNQRTMSFASTLSGDMKTDMSNLLSNLNRIRKDINSIPEDPYIVYPTGDGSSFSEKSGDLLSPEKVVPTLTPVISDLSLTGIWSSGRIFTGNSNSLGQEHWFESDSFSLDYSLIASGERMLKGTYAGTSWDGAEFLDRINGDRYKLDILTKDPVEIKPGKYRTFIESAGVSDLVSMFSWGGISESSIQQAESSLCKMRSDSIKLSPCFSLSEDFKGGSVPRFNSNGEVSPERLDLIVSGALKNTLVSSNTSKEYKVESNFAERGEYLRSPYMGAGDLDNSDVLSELGTGLYLSNLHYLNWSDRIGGRVTGMTRYACFWVEDGELVSPIKDMRFDDSIYNFFGDSLEDATKNVTFNPNVGTYNGRSLGGTHCPGILLSSFEMTL